jgi:hypothetical protein
VPGGGQKWRLTDSPEGLSLIFAAFVSCSGMEARDADFSDKMTTALIFLLFFV